jgi:hypothetical protein
VTGLAWYAYDSSQEWGGLYTHGVGPTIAATAYGQTFDWMVGATMTSPCIRSVEDVWTCGLSRPGGYTAEAVWIPNSEANFTVPSQFVEFRDLAGNVYPITGSTVPIADSPILLESGPLPEQP